MSQQESNCFATIAKPHALEIVVKQNSQSPRTPVLLEELKKNFEIIR